MRLRLTCLWAAAGSVALSLFSAPPDRSREKEAALGAQMAFDVERHSTALDAGVNRYVEDLGERLARQMPDAEESWTFRAIIEHGDNPTHEPIALPGGFIYVSDRLILAAQNEAEVAGMMAHAMAHVAERQTISKVSREDTARLASLLLTSLQTREYEPEADRAAVRIMAAAGYDPHALLQLIKRVQTPPLSIRESNLREAIEAEPTGGKLEMAAEFRSIQETIREARVIPSLQRAAK